MKRQSINTGQRLSPSARKIIKLRQRAFQSGGTSLELQIPTDYIRDISRDLSYDITRDADNRNLIKYSEEFVNPVWLRQNATPTANTIANPLNGNIDGTTFSSTGGIFPSLYQFLSKKNVLVTMSVYAKANTLSYLAYVDIGGNFAVVWFDLSNGTIGTNIGGYPATIQDAGNGWYRCSVTQPSWSGGFFQIMVASADNVTTGIGSIYVYGAQMEYGSIVSNYKKTTTSIGEAGASLIMTPNTIGESRLFNAKPEIPSGINLFKYSEEFDNAVWGRNATSIDINSTTAPDGTLTADTVRQDGTATTSGRRIYQSFSPFSGIYTISIFAKKKDFDGIAINFQGTSNAYAAFNINNGTIINTTGGTLSYSITPEVSGWYKCIATVNISGTNRIDIIICDASGNASFNNTNTFGNYIWGAQLELGSKANSYSKTSNNASTGIIDFQATRATTATVIQKDGSIGDSCYNLLQRSEEFENAYWIKLNSTITANATTDINGNLFADKLIETTSTSTHKVTNPTSGTTGSGFFTLSIYVKSAERTEFALQFSDAVNDSVEASFNLTTLEITIYPDSSIWNSLTARIEDAKNGYKRLIFTVNRITNGTVYVQYYLVKDGGFSYAGIAGEGAYIWGAQLVQGSTPKDYLKTTNRLNVPSIYYSLGSDKPALLVEPQRTNTAVRSQEMETANWTKVNGTITANSAIAPDGTMTADAYFETAATGLHELSPTSIAISPGNQYTFSIYIKPNGRDLYSMSFLNSSFNSTNIYFDLINKTIYGSGNNDNATIDSLPNGWFRLSNTDTSSGTTTGAICYIRTVLTGTTTSFAGDVTKGFYAWGGQVEIGFNPTSYIPTTSASVTRNAYTSFVDLWNNNLLNKDNFTIYFEGFLQANLNTNVMIALSDTTGTSTRGNDVGIFDGARATAAINGAVTFDSLNLFPNSEFRIVIVRDGNSVKWFRNGVQIWSTQTINPVDYRYLVVNTGGSTYSLKRISVWKHTKSDADAITLTLPNNAAVLEPNTFYSTWNTGNTSTGSSGASQVRLPLVSTGTYNFTVDWGDGITDTITTYNQAQVTHTYASAGQYTLKIKGVCTGWQFIATGDRLKILNILQWGPLRLGTTQGYYLNGCSNLNLSYVTDVLNLSGTTSMQAAFAGCISLTVINRINEWNTSGVTNLRETFNACNNFNDNIGNWNVSNVTTMYQMFTNSGFNNGGTSLNSWNVSNVTTMFQMFSGNPVFNQNIGNWNVSSCGDFGNMFLNASAFNNGGSNSINNWVIKTTGTVFMNTMFQGATVFNQPIGNWNTQAVTIMSSMFQSAPAFNQNISSWNVSAVTTFLAMFNGATNFNNGLASGVSGTMPWTINTIAAVSMSTMFQSATSFNQDISSWNTSQVNNMSAMFNGANKFNQPIGTWNTSNVINMGSMFVNASIFNQDLNSWNVSKVTDYTSTFNGASAFNNGLANGVAGTMSWNINTLSNVVMTNMFANASAFNQNIGTWDVGRVTNMSSMFNAASKFNNGNDPSINNWNTSLLTTMNNIFQSAVAFNQPIGLWNIGGITSMISVFNGAAAFNQNIGAWNVSNVSNFGTDHTNGMFQGATAFNNGGSPDINNWVIKTSGPVTMGGMFRGAAAFNQPIGSWNVSRVTNMYQMFFKIGTPSVFNQDIGTWDVSSVTTMYQMFWDCAFNNGGSPSIDNWNTSAVTNMDGMFNATEAFNQPIGNWNVSNVTVFGLFMGSKTPALYSAANLDALYNGWSSRPVKPGLSINFGTAKYTAGASAGRAILTGAPNNWVITDGGI